MSGSVNKCIIVGNVGRDPEMRATQDGRRIANLSIATSESWRDKASGERKEKTEWHRVVIFDERIAEVVEKYVRKGSKVYVEGALQTRKWTDKDGQERYSTEVVLAQYRGTLTMLSDGSGERSSGGSSSSSSSGGGYSRRRDPPASGGGGGGRRDDDLDSEIPFLDADPRREPGIASKAAIL